MHGDFEQLDCWLATATFRDASPEQRHTLEDIWQGRARAAGRPPLTEQELMELFRLTHSATVSTAFVDGLVTGRLRIVGERDGECLFESA